MILTENDFNKFSSLIYETSGIFLHQSKKELVHARLGKILRERNINSYSDYYKLVIADKTGKELVTLLDAISTNQTFFFREYDHFEFLKGIILPALVEYKKKVNNLNISIWSAGCSSGEEPYSIALILKEFLGGFNQWSLKILATDISTRMLKRASLGIYDKEQLSKVPDLLIKKYFQYGVGEWNNFFRVKKEIKEIIQFKRFNLLDVLQTNEKFDVIFCRNVLIYFDPETRERIINKFEQHLYPKGYLMIGHSESLINISHNLKYIKPAIYKK